MSQNLPTQNNNPGDLRDPSTGSFQQFSNPSQGYAALLNDIQSKMDGASSTGLNGNSNLVDFSKVYAPDSDGNNSGQYAANLANQLGVNPDTSIGSLEPRIGDFAKAIATNEGYDDNSTQDVSQDPKTQAITSGNPASSGMPTWEKWALGTAAVGIPIATGIGALLTDGLDIPVGAEAESAVLGAEGAGAAAGATETAAGAGEAATEAQPGLISKGLGMAKNALVGEGIAQGANQVKGLFGGSQTQPPASTTSTATPQNYNDPATPLKGSQIPQAVGASKQIYDGLNSALQQTQTGRILSQSPAGQAGLTGLSEYGITPEVINGNYDSTEAMEKNQNMVGDLSDSVGQVLEAEGEHANLDDATGAAIENMHQYTPSNEWAEAEGHIKAQAETYRQFADEEGNISLGTMERMKKEQYKSAGNWDSTTTSAKRAAHKALGVGAKSTILKNTKNKELYERAMKEESKLINGQKVLKKLNGKKAHKKDSLTGDVVHHLTQYAAIAVGDRIGGPFGAIVGGILGNRMEKIIGKKFGQNVLETKSMSKALEIIGKKDPEVGKLLQSIIKNYKLNPKKAKEEEKLLLPEIEEKKHNYKEGTYKLKKNEISGLYDIANYRKPGQRFYTKKGRPTTESLKRKEAKKGFYGNLIKS